MSAAPLQNVLDDRARNDAGGFFDERLTPPPQVGSSIGEPKLVQKYTNSGIPKRRKFNILSATQVRALPESSAWR